MQPWDKGHYRQGGIWANDMSGYTTYWELGLGDALSRSLATNLLPLGHQINVPVMVRIGKTRLTTQASTRVGQPKISPE